MSFFQFRRPSEAMVNRLVDESRTAPFSYNCVGASRRQPPAGWQIDDQRLQLGTATQFPSAKRALKRWAQFDLEWVFPVRNDIPLQPGQLFSFVSFHFGLWATNVCRIVYVIDENTDDNARFGFAYGTVGNHSVRGEEKFMLELDKRTDQLFFRVSKFSRPAHLLTFLALPLTIFIQHRFTRDALTRLQQEVTPNV
jgi:uncharacterized protein (UPF0548 family)